MKHTIHESKIKTVQLPGRLHKMIVKPENMGTKRMCFGIADFPAQAHAPAHVHKKEEEIIYILTGSGKMFFDGKSEPIKPGTCIFIPPKVVHSINNTSKQVMKLVYVFSPPVVQGSYDKK
ncbi:MAG: cupin domain-containing protein [Candidatus Firestonebacteria bacterium]